MNLVVNARNAMGGVGRIHVRASGAVRRDGGQGPRLFARFTVCDSGPGVPPEVRDRIFDPFFTTRNIGQGMGLGLSIVHGVARSHAGFAELDPSGGSGASFSVYFPAIA
jgi:signal transduction histidine kinase